MGVKFKYYRAEGEKAERVKAHIKSEIQKARNKQAAFCDKYWIRYIGMRGTYILWIGFTEKVEFPHLKYIGESKDEELNTVYKYEPNKRYKVGKELYREIKAAKSFDYSDYICSEFRVTNSVFSPPYLHSSVAGTQGENLVFEIPYDDENPLPTIPSELIEITEAEFKGLTQ